jgi:hypothetical protein
MLGADPPSFLMVNFLGSPPLRRGAGQGGIQLQHHSYLSSSPPFLRGAGGIPYGGSSVLDPPSFLMVNLLGSPPFLRGAGRVVLLCRKIFVVWASSPQTPNIGGFRSPQTWGAGGPKRLYKTTLINMKQPCLLKGGRGDPYRATCLENLCIHRSPSQRGRETQARASKGWKPLNLLRSHD